MVIVVITIKEIQRKSQNQSLSFKNVYYYIFEKDYNHITKSSKCNAVKDLHGYDFSKKAITTDKNQ